MAEYSAASFFDSAQSRTCFVSTYLPVLAFERSAAGFAHRLRYHHQPLLIILEREFQLVRDIGGGAERADERADAVAVGFDHSLFNVSVPVIRDLDFHLCQRRQSLGIVLR